MPTLEARAIFEGSDGMATKAYYAHLETFGPAGLVAMNLFRAQKCSTRAKAYRGRGFKDAAYARKQWSMGLLCEILREHGEAIGVTFGWKEDEGARYNPWVLYVDLPQGQVSFHSPVRGEGPSYAGQWDGVAGSEGRILAFCDAVSK